MVSYDGAGLTSPRHLLSDHQGSIVAATSATGAVAWTNRYDEYGIPATTNAGRFQYTGQIWMPELGMYHYKARIYSPTLGRFLQTDPIGYEGGMNLYAYVGDDPVNLVDFRGTRPGDPYLTAKDASVDWQNTYNERSIRENVEYNGAVYQQNGRFYSTEGVSTTFQGGTSRIRIPRDATHVEDDHTHAAYTRMNSRNVRERTSRAFDEFQSDTVNSEDISRARSAGRPVTVGTPSGDYKRYDPATRQVETIRPYVPTVVPPDPPPPAPPRPTTTPDRPF